MSFVWRCKFFILYIRHLEPASPLIILVFYNIFYLFPFTENIYQMLPDEFTGIKIAPL